MEASNPETMSNDQIQLLVDHSVSRSVHSAVNNAMAAMQESLVKSVAMAISQTSAHKEHQTQQAKKCSAKRRHVSHDNLLANKQRKIVTSARGLQTNADLPSTSNHEHDAEKSHPIPSTREENSNKRVTFASDTVNPSDYYEINEGDDTVLYEDENDMADNYSELSDVEDPSYVPENNEGVDIYFDSSNNFSESTILDGQGLPFFDPSQIVHPRSGEWTPNPEIEEFISYWIRKSLDSKDRNKLRAECPRPTLPLNAAQTPELDPILVRYIQKSGKNPKKGMDRNFKICQDKFLDLLGPLTKIMEITENAYNSGTMVDANTLRGWIQRAICLFGNINEAFCTERRRSILLKLDPQLTHLATTQPPSPTGGFLFGEQFIKEISKYVGLFSSLDKAQSSLKKVFPSKIFGRAGRSRGRFPGRYPQYRAQYRGPSYQTDRASFHIPPPQPQPQPFFPYRARPWRPRGQRGYTRSRPQAY
ncbi:uncharacterized protein LOC130362153 [Hyla sarda]|uniref:uncharacterized protein LOC130294478 n=1 Tax=Hyla sarda TaxID=327740 RepID=UPI0024C2A77C|nr:uncharacterized protein LOC130294478 [Hyla sarda]XP_056416749.1 uncharacterized protein LOC130357980 [Hyla sarda]XP_056422174.1 uncharacterized protein LOC130362153 [Hyla sarda]